MNPRVLKQEGFKHLDRVIELCSKQGIYTVLDLHTAPGGQNQVSVLTSTGVKIALNIRHLCVAGLAL